MVTNEQAAKLIAEEIKKPANLRILKTDLQASMEYWAEGLTLTTPPVLTEQQMLKGLVELEKHVLPKIIEDAKTRLAAYPS